ncbi:putative endoplasmic reticulum oxidoreductin 1 (ERO1) [Schistosoma mansoni]|uniref:putative endoplasmic reticulum oxidoreductin 1 (ERO1) n=1 Tax=Schistosoma mansoni TaxID=6183 RepID=UPI0001A633DA|nr:putative endoplasmic reticulum oxidoreductin 1 (ERO1) [Schistosoma mansoni]|eukprot:XP_018648568.1 putative endoplasmic reticulum oxidoreductin 1 (ERO1) [Schistosoma mansoni]
MIRRGALLLFVTLFAWSLAQQSKERGRCFSLLSGMVDDINADIQKITGFNNLKVLPRIKNILQKDFFHYFEVNLERGCPFFDDDKRCPSSDCRVKDCPAEEIPLGLREDSLESSPHHKYSKEANMYPEGIDCGLGKLDSSLSEERKTIIANWTRHDHEDELTFCEPDDDSSGKMIYVDLLKNPERYTGYKGPASNRIWYMVYNENCFNEDSITYGTSYLGPSQSSCLEKRAFYRMVSGLHSSISVHLSYRYPLSLFSRHQPISRDYDSNNPGWGPNLEEFRRRFDPSIVPDGLTRLRNLYFTYLVELRALAKAAPYLMKQTYFTGDEKMDKETRSVVTDFLQIIQNEGSIFNEHLLFTGDINEANVLKKQFREHFRNISRIMDCVGCEKCRLWGKLQYSRFVLIDDDTP